MLSYLTSMLQLSPWQILLQGKKSTMKTEQLKNERLLEHLKKPLWDVV